MKKILAIIMALAIVLGLCACGAGGNSGNNGGDKTADGKVKLSIGLPTNAMVLDHDKNALTNWVEKECNVELSFTEYPGGTDLATQITTTVAGRQELPDILFGIELSDDTITRYGKDGYFVDLTKYYEDKEGASKTFWDRITNELSETDRDLVLKTIQDTETGAYYCVPTVETSLIDKMDSQVWINQKWLDKLGLKAPTNTKELLDVLRAFKEKDPNGNGIADEIPLFGTQNANGSMPIHWILNMFCYYNTDRPYNVGKDGKLYPIFTSDEYREGLKFANQLYKEGLLTAMAWTANASEMKQIVTSSTGTAMAGIFCAHLTGGTTIGSEILYDYVPLEPFWNVIRHDTSCTKNTFITEDCDNPDKAFEVLMKLWTWDGSMRVRYGEYGVNWDDADPGAKSDIGLEATYKLISDPLKVQGTAKWAEIASTLNICAEGETAQLSELMTEWEAKKSAMHAESYRLFAAREAVQDNSHRCPTLTRTAEEEERVKSFNTNIGTWRNKALTDFITGVMDPNSDSEWKAYKAEMDNLGINNILDVYQKAYDRS